MAIKKAYILTERWLWQGLSYLVLATAVNKYHIMRRQVKIESTVTELTILGFIRCIVSAKRVNHPSFT